MQTRVFLVSMLLFTLLWTGCTYTEKIKDGRSAYAQHQFAVAIDLLPKDIKKAETIVEKGELYYMMAESHRRTSQPNRAAEWYGKAADAFYGKDARLRQARALQELENYSEAIQAFKQAGIDAGNVNTYLQEIQACQKAKQWIAEKDSNAYAVESLPFNTEDTDFAPSLIESQRLLFASDRQESAGKDLYKWTQEKFFDLYTVHLDSNMVRRYDFPDNTDYHQGDLIYSPDGTKAYFTSCGTDKVRDVDYCRIFMMEKRGASWLDPKPLQLGADKSANYMHPCLSADGNQMYFASNNKNGYGGYDIFVSEWDAEAGYWTKGLNLGHRVNTKGNEVFPFLHNDSLYFSSDGHLGMGGLDLFKVVKKQGYFQNRENLKAPMNSGGDDFGLIIDSTAQLQDSLVQMGYFSSNRQAGAGSDDIYRFYRRILPTPDTPALVVDTPQVLAQIFLEGKLLGKTYAQPESPSSEVTGSEPLSLASVEVLSSDTAFTLAVNPEGTFSFPIKAGLKYVLTGTRQGYLSDYDTVSTVSIILDSLESDTTLYAELLLDKKFVGQEIVLEGIYYDYDESFIRDDAKPILNDLVRILKENPDINIQLVSHTDCRGSRTYNQALSQDRAESAVEYIVEQGITRDRLRAKGEGEDSPANDCACNRCTEDEHEQNRRTTFKIIE